MTTVNYRTTGTYLIYAEDSAWGTAGTPAAGSYIDRVTSFSATIENNPIITQGIGEGPNAKKIINGGIDVTGDVNFTLTDPSFLQYMFLGLKSGAGTVADPYEIAEVDNLGYAATEVNSITLEAGKTGSTGDVMSYDGVFFESFTVSGTQGEDNPIVVNGSWTGRNAIPSTTTETFSGPSNRSLCWIDSKVEIDSARIAQCQSFSITCTINYAKRRELGNRFLLQPVLISRRYSVSLSLRMNKDTDTTLVDALRGRSLVLGGTTASAVATTAADMTLHNLSIVLQEGLLSGDRVVRFDFENTYFQNWTEPIELENGDIEVTCTAIPISGLTDSTVKVPCRWWTIT